MRAQIWWDAWRDARGGLTPDMDSPRTQSYLSAADARCQVIKQVLARELEQMEAALAQLKADHDSLQSMWPNVPDQGAQAVTADALDLTDPAMRSSIRSAGRRFAVGEELRRLDIEAAGLEKTIESKNEAAKAQQEAEKKRGEVCRHIYLATLKRHASEYPDGISQTGMPIRSGTSGGPRHGTS
jgi:hypothetical protein